MNPDPMERTLRYRWLIFGILALGYIMVYFHRLCTAVVAVDMMRDLEAGGTIIGLLAAAYFYPYALMQLPAGLLSDSWGPRRTITLFFCVASLGSLLLGLAPGLFWALLGRTLVGLGVAMLFVSTMKVLAEWFRVREFATMTGILMAMGGVGLVISTTPLALLSSALGWRMSFVIVGVFTAVMAALVWIIVRDRPADRGLPSPVEHARDEVSIGLLEGMKRVLSYPPFWAVAIWFFFIAGIFFSFGGLWGGPYLMHLYNLSSAEAGNILMMSAIGMITGSPFLGFVSNRVMKGRKPIIIISTVITVGLMALLAFYTEKIPLFGLYGLLFFMGFFTSSIVVIGFTTTKELFPVQIAGTSTGLVNLFPFAGGAVLQPLLGYFIERQGRIDDEFTLAGYQHAFFILFLCGLAAFIASLFIKETFRGE